MKRRFAAVAWIGLALGGCGHEAPPPAEVAAIRSCPDSEESGCENGKPLCAFDTADACLMCRCTEYPRLASDSPGGADLSMRPRYYAPSR